MVEQMKSIGFNARNARFVEKAPTQLIDDVLAIVDVCLR